MTTSCPGWASFSGTYSFLGCAPLSVRGKQLFGVFAGDLAGADGALGGAGLLVLLDAAQLVGQGVGVVLHLLHQVMGLLAGGVQFGLALADQLVALGLGAGQGIFGLGAGLLGVVLGGFQLQFQIIQLGQHAVQPLVVAGHVGAGRRR